MKCAGFATVPLLLAGCKGPLSTLSPAGPIAQDIAWLWWALLAGAALLALLVFVLVALSFGRPREVPEKRWTFGLGVWFSLAVLTLTLAAALWVGERILPHGPALEVHAHARQWSWTFSHPGAQGPNEAEGVLHIPAGQPVDVLITSSDVIHSFWVPQLGGKMDAIPGRQNRLRIEATRPGTYEGLCAEFCGLEHASMRFEVIAHDPADWPPASLPVSPPLSPPALMEAPRP
ncbi:cytochrome c oxidase subunit 2 [Ancylobacter aquaticus]|uniref:Cytochrome aa3 subunit 2 n=1 Tax=Ancylobacter aquaticus TaxID=100 RepID=A0A4R1I1S8_ANCAQ|nr:cytochrome c oxidase subunit II [Ancylobacter aquaticus]TCK29134.1 cytochrome c oxidase subunit 2 [Ancylobacter aquaticus]